MRTGCLSLVVSVVLLVLSAAVRGLPADTLTVEVRAFGGVAVTLFLASAVLLAVFGVLAVVTERWLGLFVSLGVIGFAVTFALQQPLFSIIAWIYITAKSPTTSVTASLSRIRRAT